MASMHALLLPNVYPKQSAVGAWFLLPIFHLQMSGLNSMASDPIRGGQELPWEAGPISS